MPEQVEPSATSTESADDLLRRLELEMASRRAGRERTEGQRAALLAGGLMLIFAAAAGALLFAFSMLNDLAARDRPPNTTPATALAPR